MLQRLDEIFIFFGTISVLEKKHGLEKIWSVTKSDEYLLSIADSKKLILNHFGIKTLDTLGLGNTKLCLIACAQILQYLLETQKGFMPNLTIPYYYNINDYEQYNLVKAKLEKL